MRPVPVAPAVPTVVITRLSWFAPVSTTTVWPTAKPVTLCTLMFVAPAALAAARVVMLGPAAATAAPLCVVRSTAPP